MKSSHSGSPQISVGALGMDIRSPSIMDSTKTAAVDMGGSSILEEHPPLNTWYPKSTEPFPTNDSESCIG